ncbi:MAG: hypothetical protein ACC645_21535 [Pirellulales bacterium]
MGSVIGAMKRVVVIAVCLNVLGVSGCGKKEPSGPTYAEALTIYNQELQRLDRLKQQRDELQGSLDAPQTDALEEVATQLLGNSAEMRKETLDVLQDLTGTTGAADTSDAASKQQEALDAVQKQLAVAQEAKAKQRQEREAGRKKAETRIGELNKEIAEQEKKVARSKADLDRADADRK